MTGITWEQVESNAVCDTDNGEVYRDNSPGKVAGLEACQQACAADAGCRSITYLNTGWCSHYSTPCTVTKPQSKATAFKKVTNPHATTLLSTTLPQVLSTTATTVQLATQLPVEDTTPTTTAVSMEPTPTTNTIAAPTEVTTPATTSTTITTTTIAFAGNYDDVVGNDKEQFLQECTTLLSSSGNGDVECINVRPGSIIVDVRGPETTLAAAMADVESNGLDMPSFPMLTTIQTTAVTTAATTTSPAAPAEATITTAAPRDAPTEATTATATLG